MRGARSEWDCFRGDVLAAMAAGVPEQLARLTWTAERIQQEQAERLQTLLAHAIERSPFHRRRLAGIDVAAVDPADLSALPVMTKAQMMGALDDIFTDRRLNRGDVEAALAATTTHPVPILDDYIALASGGCSGQRGVFVLDRAGVTSFGTAVGREPVGATLRIGCAARAASDGVRGGTVGRACHRPGRRVHPGR